jgi:hypothetical protein
MVTASVETLCKIMLDEDVPLRRRIEAAEQILSFEASVDATDEAKAFLTEVFEDGTAYVDMRLDALKIIRKAEARKVALPPASVQTGERGPLYKIVQARARYALQKELEAKGLWPAPPGWDSHIMSPDWPGPTDEEPLNPIGLADRLGAARQAYLEKEQEKKTKAEGPKDE